MISIRVRRKPSFSHLQRLFHASTPFKNAFQRQSTARIRIEHSSISSKRANQIQHQPRISRRPATPSRLRQLSDRDIHSPRIELFRQTRCHLLHLRVKHEHTPSTWLIQDRAITAPILLLPSKDMATSSSECSSISAYI
jgi:hypothetical protein